MQTLLSPTTSITRSTPDRSTDITFRNLKGKLVLHIYGHVADRGGVLSIIRGIDHGTKPLGLSHLTWVNQCYQEARTPQLSYVRTRHFIQQSSNHLNLFFRSLLGALELRTVLRDFNIDILHGHSRGALPVCLLAGLFQRRPIIHTNHAYARHRTAYRWAARLPWMTSVVYTSEMVNYYGLESHANRVHVIPACCPDQLFTRPLACPNPFASNRPIRLVGIGSKVRWKNWHLVIEALGSLPPADQNRFEFHLWGPQTGESEGLSYSAELIRMARDRVSAQVTFHEATNDVESVLRNADWCILPSTNEPCGITYLEGLALGVPAIVSRSGGPVDLVKEDRTGLFFEPDSATSLRDQFRRILRQNIPLLTPSELRQSVEKCNETSVAQRYAVLYSDRLENSTESRRNTR